MKCPNDDRLREHAQSGTGNDEVAAHVAECASCQRRISELCDDATALEELRAAWNSRMDEPVKRRIDDICREAVNFARNSDCDDGGQSAT